MTASTYPPAHTHIYIYVYIYNSYNILYIHIGSRQHPLHLSSCYCYGYRFWGGLSLSRVLWKSAYSRSNMKPKSIPRQARKWIEELFCWFQVLRQHSMFLSCCNVAFICMHIPSFSFHLHACSFHVAFMSFYFLSKVMEMALWLGQGTEYNKWLSLTYR